jgi:hypothetical protein
MIKTTKEYFNLTTEELMEIRNEYGYTKEECLIFDDGLEIVFFDDEKEMKEEEKEFNEYMKEKKYEVKAILETVNERLAVILV